MTPRDLIDDLRSRINPAYAAQVGTESWERRLCVEAMEAQADEIERLRAEIDQLREINAGLRRHANGVADDNRKLLAEIEAMKRQKPAAWMCPDDPDSATAFSWKPVACELASCLKRRVPLYLAPGAQTAPSVPDGWQPIETAPRDGTRVLLSNKSGTRVADGMYGNYKVWSWPYVLVEPAYWRPMPAAPGAQENNT